MDKANSNRTERFWAAFAKGIASPALLFEAPVGADVILNQALRRAKRHYRVRATHGTVDSAWSAVGEYIRHGIECEEKNLGEKTQHKPWLTAS